MLSNVQSVTVQNILRRNVPRFGYLLREIGQRLCLAPTMLDPRKYGYQRKLEFFFWLQVTIKKKIKWYLDSGCLRHMIGDSSYFIKLVQMNDGKVSFGGNNKWRIIGCETVKIGSLTIYNVSLVEGLNYNLLSISQLCD